jgi:hypothetical protein
MVPATEIVLDPLHDGALLQLLPPLQDFFPPPVVDVGRRHVADALVITPVVLVVDEVGHRPLQFSRALVDQQVQPGFDRLVEALQLAVGLRVVGRSALRRFASCSLVFGSYWTQIGPKFP